MMSWTLQHYALIIWLPTFLKEQRGLATLATALLSCARGAGQRAGQPARRQPAATRPWARQIDRRRQPGLGNLRRRHLPRLLPDLARYALCVIQSFVGGLIPASVLSSSAQLARTPKQIGTLQGLFMQVGNSAPSSARR
jgi:CP family cyanate transporter-like MFS transporter